MSQNTKRSGKQSRKRLPIDYMPHISNVASEMECTGLIPVQPETEDERDSYLELSSTSLPPVCDEDDDNA